MCLTFCQGKYKCFKNSDNINCDYSKLESHPWPPPLGLFWDQDKHSSRNEMQLLTSLDIEHEKPEEAKLLQITWARRAVSLVQLRTLSGRARGCKSLEDTALGLGRSFPTIAYLRLKHPLSPQDGEFPGADNMTQCIGEKRMLVLW